MNFIRERIEAWRQRRAFTAQNCINRQRELQAREERREVEEAQRRLDSAISEIENLISFKVNQSYKQHYAIFQVNDGEEEMFQKIKEHFVSNGFNAFFQKMDNLPVEALVISWM